MTPAAKTPASPRPPEEAAIDGALETAPTAPGGAGRCRARLFSSLTAGRCHMGGGAIVDGAPGVFAAGGRAVSRPPPERISHGVRQTSAARGGAKERPAPSRPRRVGRRHDGAGPPTNACVTLKWPARRVPSRLSAITIVRCQRRSSLFLGERAVGLFSFRRRNFVLRIDRACSIHGKPGGCDTFLDAATPASTIVRGT